jgi:hypothetical protein
MTLRAMVLCAVGNPEVPANVSLRWHPNPKEVCYGTASRRTEGSEATPGGEAQALPPHQAGGTHRAQQGREWYPQLRERPLHAHLQLRLHDRWVID